MILLMLGAAGCGSDDGTTVQGSAAGPSTSAGPEEAEQQSDESGGAAGRKARRDSGDGPEAGRNGQANGAGKAERADGRDANSAQRQQVKRKLEQECPPDADDASCEAMVDGFIAGRGDSKGKPLNDPEDCTQTRSKQECERDLRAQKAAEDTYSVDVEECLADPTPRCEAVLRPLFEQQQAAEEAGR